MVNFTVDEIREIMKDAAQIRNMSVIAHVDHGKSTLSDSLIAKAGIIAAKNAGDERYMDTRADEKERGITIKSTGVTLYFQYEEKNYLINLIDSPGHVDFSSEVTAALRVTDGALVVVDTVEGVCVQTETVLRQAMQERIKPVLMVNKVDRPIIELQLNGEKMYQSFIRCIDMVNVVINTYEQTEMGPIELSPTKGNVSFGSGKDCWAFSLNTFAKIYSKKFGIEKNKMMEKLWGDNYFDAKAKKWRNTPEAEDGTQLPRAFCQFIMNPLISLCKACLENDVEKWQKLTVNLNIELTQEEKEYKGKQLLKTVMSRWINAAEVVLEMMVLHLPSPKEAQKYRTSYLYEGPQDDALATSMRECNKDGPLMVYISKMVPTSDKGRFYAFGRVFSGTIKTGQKVRIMGPNFVPGKKVDLQEKNVQRTVIMMGRKVEDVPEVTCGNTVALVGIDQYLTKTGTIADIDHPEAHNIRVMKYSVSPVVRVAVKAKNPAELPKLIAGMQRLAKSDPLVLCINDQETGENIIAGSGELHVEICINDLINEYAQIEIIQSDPVVSYRETITEKTDVAMTKSSNKHNRLYATAEPLEEEFSLAVEDGKIDYRDPKKRAKQMSDDYGFDKNDALKLWAFGPDGEGPNIILDVTKGCQYMNELKEHVISGFEQATKGGILCNEPMRGVRFNITDTYLHNDSIHRGGGQITPASRRLCFANQLMGKPTLQEPFFMIEVTCPAETAGAVYGALAMKRGQVDEEIPIEGTPMVLLKGFFPVSESFGFTEYLREKTGGKAFPNCVFDHWENIPADNVRDPNCRINKLVLSIRKRKGLKEEIPALEDYFDKL